MKKQIEQTATRIINELTVTAKPRFSSDEKGQLFDELYRTLAIRFRKSGCSREEIKEIAGQVVSENL